MRLVKRCHQAMRRDAGRVMTIITIDDRASGTTRAGLRMAQKVRSLEVQLGKSLSL